MKAIAPILAGISEKWTIVMLDLSKAFDTVRRDSLYDIYRMKGKAKEE